MFSKPRLKWVFELRSQVVIGHASCDLSRQPWLKADLEKYKPDYVIDVDVKIRCGKGKKPFITLLRDIIQTS